jgi:hypothetical protein
MALPVAGFTDEPVKEDSTSHAHEVEWSEEPVAKEAPLQWRSERPRNARKLLFIDNDERTTYAKAMMNPDS